MRFMSWSENDMRLETCEIGYKVKSVLKQAAFSPITAGEKSLSVGVKNNA